MAQLARLRKLVDAHERAVTTVQGFAEFVLSTSKTEEKTCGIRMCFLRGDHFNTERSHGTHLHFIDAESAQAFTEVSRLLLSVPGTVSNGEICRLTVWENIKLTQFVPGTIYEIRHAYNLTMYEKMPQAWVSRICAEDRKECPIPTNYEGCSESSISMHRVDAATTTRQVKRTGCFDTYECSTKNNSASSGIDSPEDTTTTSGSHKRKLQTGSPISAKITPFLPGHASNKSNQARDAQYRQSNAPSHESLEEKESPPPPAKRQHTSKNRTADTSSSPSTTE